MTFRMLIGNLLSVAVGVSAFVSACGGTSAIGGDSETHFLADCGVGCPGNMLCACGLCTLLCDSDTNCSGLSENAECVNLRQGSCEASEPVCDVLCTADADCEHLGASFACDAGACRQSGGSVGQGGTDSTNTTTASSTATSASTTTSAGGSTSTSTSTSTDASTTTGGGGASPECCLDSALVWQLQAELPTARYSLGDCDSFQRESTCNDCGITSCASRMPACDSEGSIGADDLNAALANADVASAVERAPLTFGVDARPVDGSAFVLDIGGAEIVVGSECPADDETCEATPAGVLELVTLLDAVVEQQVTLGSCAQALECQLPVPTEVCEVGPPMYYYDKASFTCVISSACESEGNTFASLLECDSACGNDPCAQSTPFDPNQANDCPVAAEGRCFADGTQACRCACTRVGGDISNCTILEPVPATASCTPGPEYCSEAYIASNTCPAGCQEMLAYPIVDGCVDSTTPEVVGCLNRSDCSADLTCYERTSDSSRFMGFGSTCFDELSNFTRCPDVEYPPCE